MADEISGAGSDPDEELILPSDLTEEEARRVRKPVAIPRKTRSAGPIQRRLVGEDARRLWEQTHEEVSAEDSPVEFGGGSGAQVQADGTMAAGVGEAQPGAGGRRRRRHREPEGEDAWIGQRTSLWWVLAGLGCMLVLGYFLAGKMRTEEAVAPFVEPTRNVLKDNIDGTPIAEFVERSTELLPVLIGLLDEYYDADRAGAVDLVRGGEESIRRRDEWRARQATPARAWPITLRQLHAAAVEGTGYLVMTGLDEEYLSAAAYFVREDGKYLFDWEASEGYSEVLPSELEGLTRDDPQLMRVVVEPKVFYTPVFREEEYRCYALHHQDQGDFVWAYAKRDSVVDRSLLASYYYPDLGGTERRATVRVRKGPEGARERELEIVEFLHTDWITPN